jgi:PAS domain S-box-containing protein
MRTLFLILFLVNVVLTLMLFIFWRAQKTHYGFSTWMLSLLVTSCGYFIFVIGGSLPLLLSSTLADLLIVMSVMMRLDSTGKYFRSQALPWIVYCALIPVVLLLLWFTFGVDSQIMRGVIIGLLIVPSFLATSFIAIRVREPETRSLRYSFAAALMVTGLLWTVITIIDLITPGNHSLMGPDPINPIFFIVTIHMDIVSTASFLMLNMARSQSGFRQSEERYRNLADNLPDYVIVHDQEFIRYANPAAGRLVGQSPETLVGKPISSFLTLGSAEASRTFIAAARSGDPPAPGGIDIQLPDGNIRHCMIKTVRIEDNGIPAFLSVIIDITEQKATEDALSRVNKKLSILSSITRHDIKNQLAALLVYLELSKGEIGTIPVPSGYLKKEIMIAETMERQIDFTKIYEDMGTTAPAWQNVDACVRRSVAALPMPDVAVEVDRSDLEVYADPLFEKVFYNLIDNALKYRGKVMTAIHVTSRETGTGLVITCEDNGAGIAGPDKKHLFERGYGKHTGLGLFLSREILSITGIMITETSDPGKGARFEMTVPNDAYRLAGKK